MAKIKKGDFIELEYTGRLKETDEVFDTTDENLAKETGIAAENMKYGPVIIAVGEGFTIKGLEDEMIGKEPGKYKIELSPEKAFGKKDAKLIKMIPFSTFRAQKIAPEPGMQINVDGMMGIIRTATGGRCLVDFNHPLSGKEVVYEIKINRLVEDDAEKIKGFLELSLKLDTEAEVKEGTAKISSKKDIPKPLHKTISEKIKELIPSVKKVEFVKAEEEKKEKTKEEEPEQAEKKNTDSQK